METPILIMLNFHEEAEYGRSETINEKGYYILPSELFQNVCKNAKITQLE